MRSVSKEQSSIIMIITMFLAAGALGLFFDKGDILLEINASKTVFGDFLFPVITHFGSGIFFVFSILFFLYKNVKNAVLLLIAAVTHGVIVGVMKNIVFNNMLRPVPFFQSKGVSLNLIEGVDIRNLDTFPSGHTTTAFALAVILAIIIRTKFPATVLIFLAFCVAFSRLYLCQHFFVDVYFGAVIGACCSITTFVFFDPKLKRLDNKNIFTLIRASQKTSKRHVTSNLPLLE